jgi:acyl-CoA thioesterase
MEDAAPGSPTTRFRADTSVEPLGDGRYRGRMDRSWWIVAGPNGGYVAAVLLRAVLAEVDDPERRPRSITLQYLRPPAEGDVQVDVTVERAGRTVTNVSARMTQEGRTLVLALASLAAARPSPIAFDEGPGLPVLDDGSAVPMPEATARIPVDPERDVPMRRHYDLRWVLGDLPFSGAAGSGDGRARNGGWLRPVEPEPVDEVVLLAMTDAWMPPLFSRVEAPLAVPTVDLTVHFRGLPQDPLDHCFAEFASPLARDGYLVEHGRILARDGRLLVESRQLAVVA